MLKQQSQSGSALVYILIAIALLAVLTASFMKPSSQQTTAQSGFNTITELKSQISYVRSAIQECVLTYQAGEAGLIGDPNFPYPINPSSTYITTPAANDEVANIKCPGNPGDAAADPAEHANIFGGTTGKFMPPPVDLFENWVYYSGVDGVFFYTRTDKTDAFLLSSMEKLDEEYSECEADIIDATGGVEELTSTAAVGDPQCPAGNTCFRVWVITQASAVYNGDTGGDEAACP